MRRFAIAGKTVDDSTDAYLIAEIGHNHEGDLGRAEELVRVAARAGASAVKLQKRHNRTLYTASMYDEPYRGRNSFGPTYGAHREALEFGATEYTRLAEVAKDEGIDLLATAFDFASVDFLTDHGAPAVKLASADLTNTPLLAYAAKTGLPLVVSTGAADLDDVRRAVDVILPVNQNLAILQCTAIYPAAPADLHLSVIRSYREHFPDLVVGFSGHDLGPELSLVAYALGARVIEKHVTLDRTRPGSDHHFSLEPDQLADLAIGLRRTREALGSPVKRVMAAERPALRKMGKKLVAARDLSAGEVLTEIDIGIKSPGDGMPPYQLDEVVGQVLRIPLSADADITADVLRARS